MDFLRKNIYETGINENDEQHKYFFDLINQLYSELTTGSNNNSIEKNISNLTDYAICRIC